MKKETIIDAINVIYIVWCLASISAVVFEAMLIVTSPFYAVAGTILVLAAILGLLRLLLVYIDHLKEKP